MTTTSSADFFAGIAYGGPVEEAEEGIPRDQWGRPLIVDPKTGEMTAYTRASTMANYIDNAFGLNLWQQRLIAQGMGHRPDLAAMAAALPPYDAMSKEQRKELGEIVDAALEVAGAYTKANHGTAIHAFTDPSHQSGPVPERMQDDVAAFEAMIDATGIVQLASEIFVVNDTYRVAGTLDAVYGVPALDALVVGDKKTGKAKLHSVTIQVANYAMSEVYDHKTGERTPLRDYLQAMHGAELPELSTSAGLHLHIPREEGAAQAHPINLAEGRRMLEVCATVRDWQQSKAGVAEDSAEWLASNRRLPAMRAIDAATDLASLKAAVSRYRWCWDERLNKYGETRWVELGSPKE